MAWIKKILKYFTPFQWAEILAVTGFTIYFAVTDAESGWVYNLISSVAAVCGIICVVLCAAGKKSQYYWGFANIAAYIAVAWISRFYGEVMLNGLYYLPSQFVGIYLWRKNSSKEDPSMVSGRRLKLIPTILLLAGTCAGIVLYRMLLIQLGGSSAWLDSASTVFSIVANALMVMRFREQWTLWVIVDVVTVIMWAGRGDMIMTTMWAVYLINAIYGFVNWTKMSRQQAENKEEQPEDQLHHFGL